MGSRQGMEWNTNTDWGGGGGGQKKAGKGKGKGGKGKKQNKGKGGRGGGGGHDERGGGKKNKNDWDDAGGNGGNKRHRKSKGKGEGKGKGNKGKKGKKGKKGMTGKGSDWTCPSCDAKVFANKTECFKCGEARPAGGGGGGGGGDEWDCPNTECGFRGVYGHKDTCPKCHAERPTGEEREEEEQEEYEMGGYEEEEEGEDGGDGEGEEEYEDTTWSSNGPSDAEGLYNSEKNTYNKPANALSAREQRQADRARPSAADVDDEDLDSALSSLPAQPDPRKAAEKAELMLKIKMKQEQAAAIKKKQEQAAKGAAIKSAAAASQGAAVNKTVKLTCRAALLFARVDVGATGFFDRADLEAALASGEDGVDNDLAAFVTGVFTKCDPEGTGSVRLGEFVLANLPHAPR